MKTIRVLLQHIIPYRPSSVSELVLINLILIALFLSVMAIGVAHAQVPQGTLPGNGDRYDPTADPNVQSYLVCIQLSSGGGDNSNLPDAEAFDEKGYVQWANGTTKAIVCQDVDKA